MKQENFQKLNQNSGINTQINNGNILQTVYNKPDSTYYLLNNKVYRLILLLPIVLLSFSFINSMFFGINALMIAFLLTIFLLLGIVYFLTQEKSVIYVYNKNGKQIIHFLNSSQTLDVSNHTIKKRLGSFVFINNENKKKTVVTLGTAKDQRRFEKEFL